MNFIFNRNKLISVVSFIIKESQNDQLDPQNILRIISASDLIHLNLYARPICNTQFVHSNIGTIGLEVKEYLDNTTELKDQGSEDYLSISDKEVLKKVLTCSFKLSLPVVAQVEIIPVLSLITNKQTLESLQDYAGLSIVL